MKQFDTQSYVYGDEMSRDWLQLFSPKSSQRYGNYGLVERFTIHYKEKNAFIPRWSRAMGGGIRRMRSQQGTGCTRGKSHTTL